MRDGLLCLLWLHGFRFFPCHNVGGTHVLRYGVWGFRGLAFIEPSETRACPAFGGGLNLKILGQGGWGGHIRYAKRAASGSSDPGALLCEP